MSLYYLIKKYNKFNLEGLHWDRVVEVRDKMSGFCNKGNETSGSTKSKKFPEELRKH